MINSIIDLLIKTSQDTPNKTGLKDYNSSYTWKEIINTCQIIASGLLKSKKVKANSNQPIPVVVNKSTMEIIVFWSIAYTGNFYVPIDEKMPLERMKKIFDALEPQAIICNEENKDIFNGLNGYELITIENLKKSQIDEELIENSRKKIIDTDPLYALFTSGSTGNPKGVICCHRSVLNYSEWVVETLD